MAKEKRRKTRLIEVPPSWKGTRHLGCNVLVPSRLAAVGQTKTQDPLKGHELCSNSSETPGRARQKIHLTQGMFLMSCWQQAGDTVQRSTGSEVKVHQPSDSPYGQDLRISFYPSFGSGMSDPLWDLIPSDRPDKTSEKALLLTPVISEQELTRPKPTGRGSSIGSVFAWHASGPEFDPHVRHILSWRLGHENISTATHPLPLIQEEQLSVTGERMCTKHW